MTNYIYFRKIFNHLVSFVLDKLLEPVDHVEEAFLIDVTQIACLEPSVRCYSSRSRFRIADIT